MDNIYNSNQQLIGACDDLRAIQAMISMAEDHGNEKETLAVTRRALEPIIDDIQDSIEIIDEALIRMRKEHVQQDGPGVSEETTLWPGAGQLP